MYFFTLFGILGLRGDRTGQGRAGQKRSLEARADAFSRLKRVIGGGHNLQNLPVDLADDLQVLTKKSTFYNLGKKKLNELCQIKVANWQN